MFDFLAEMDSNPICVFILVLIKFLALSKLNSAELREAFIEKNKKKYGKFHNW